MAAIEIISGPVSLYWAPQGEAPPAVDAAPAGNWTLLGTSGDKNYAEDGVVISGEFNTNVFRSLGSLYARKVFPQDADIMVAVTLVDFSLANLRLALNNNAVQSDAGPPAIDFIDLERGTSLTELSLLVRGTGKSPEFDGSNMQLEFTRVIEEGSFEWTFDKTEVGSQLNFRVLYDDAATYPVGRIVAATA